MKFYYPHITFFVVFLVAMIPVLYYYQRKNPNPRCRPNFGEMTMVAIVMMVIGGAMSFGIGSLFKPENDGSGLSRKPDLNDMPSSGGDSEDSPRKSRSREKEKDTGDLSGGGFKRGGGN